MLACDLFSNIARNRLTYLFMMIDRPRSNRPAVHLTVRDAYRLMAKWAGL